MMSRASITNIKQFDFLYNRVRCLLNITSIIITVAYLFLGALNYSTLIHTNGKITVILLFTYNYNYDYLVNAE